MKFNRVFAMPSPYTFGIKPIHELLTRRLADSQTIIDPFARDSKFGTLTNDLNPNSNADSCGDAIEYIRMLIDIGVEADAVLLDPPYSSRQISEAYKIAGRKCGMTETQNAVLYKNAKDGLDKLLVKGGIAITCGWNSMGFGIGRKYVMDEILLVSHGGAHNDTIVTVEIKS